MSAIRGPVHGIDLGEMSFQRLPRLHHLISRKCLLLALGNICNCIVSVSTWLWLNRAKSRDECLLTRAVSEVILLALYPILQRLSFAPSLLDARLHRLRRDILRHATTRHGEMLRERSIDLEVRYCLGGGIGSGDRGLQAKRTMARRGEMGTR